MDEIPAKFPENGKIEEENLPLIIITSWQGNRQDHFLHNGYWSRPLQTRTPSKEGVQSKDQSHDGFARSRWSAARIEFGYADRRSNHNRTPFYRTNHTCKGPDHGWGRPSRKQPSFISSCGTLILLILTCVAYLQFCALSAPNPPEYL